MHINQNIGSVEQSSFKQLEHIKLYGKYAVSAADKRSFSRLQIQDVLQLMILSEDTHAIKRQYTLDELRDLESRLILVTSHEAKNRKDVDQFMHVRFILLLIGSYPFLIYYRLCIQYAALVKCLWSCKNREMFPTIAGN